MINYIIFVNVFYSFFFLYFASKIFGLKYTKVLSYIIMLLLMIPYALIIYLKMNLEVHYYIVQLDMFIGGCAWVYTFFVRQIVLIYLTEANAIHAILYQIVYFMTSLVRLYSEDWLRFIILNSEFLVTYEYVIIGIYKLITIYIASYFANIFYQKYEIVFSNKKDIFIFIFIFLFGNVYMDNLITAFFSVLFLILTYWLLLKLKNQTKLEQMKKIKIKQIEMIEQEYQLHQNSLQLLAKIYHDEKNHMLTFNELYKKNPEKALEYIKMWQNEVKNKLEVCERE